MSTETKTAAELAAEVKANFDRKFDELKATSEEFLGKLEASDRVTEGLKQKADEALTEATEAKARLDEVEQKMVQFGERGNQDDRPKSAGYQFIENEEVKSFLANPSAGKRVGVEVKAIISSLTTDADGSAGDVLVPMRAPMVQPVNRRLTIRDLLTPGRTNTSSIQYPKETGFTNSAATVTETAGTAKAQSEMKFDIVTTSVTTIAHWVLATRQILDDSPMLQS
jgi:HK97 family phage major capsid protein